MVVELERDPQLYADGNIVEVFVVLFNSLVPAEFGPPLVAPNTRSSQPRSGWIYHSEDRRYAYKNTHYDVSGTLSGAVQSET